MAGAEAAWQLTRASGAAVEVLVDPLTGLWNHRAFRERLHAVAAARPA